MQKVRMIVLASLVAVLAFTGCRNPITPGQGGTLTVTINDAVSRSIQPGISMNPTSYNLTGTGPDGASFSETLTPGSSATLAGLAFGSWTVTATAKNSDGTAIGQGSNTVSVQSNDSVSIDITVRPFEGSGTLVLDVSWPAAQVQTAEIQSSLLLFGGSTRNLTFTVNGSDGTATYSASDVASGYHTLILNLLDNGHLAIGTVEVVRIVKDQTTSGMLAFTKVNQATGTLMVDATPEMGVPLEVSISGGAATKWQDQSMDLSAAVANYGDAVTYVWYVNGTAVETGASFSFDNTWAQGYYRIDVTAFSPDGKRAGSATSEVTVVSPVIGMVHNETESRNEAYKFYMSAHLAADDRYLVAFNASTMRFYDLTTHGEARWIKDLNVLWPGARMPQAIASIGEYVYLVTTNGRLFVVDWNNRNDPVMLSDIAIQGGQNFDLATNGVDTLFVANTSSLSFQVVSVADPSQPEVVYTDTFNGYGAGVAYYQGVAYATDYNGTLYAYKAVGGTWQRTTAIPDGVATLSGASRPAVIGDHLYVHQYNTNKFQIFSLATPGSPTPVGTLIADKNISTYARLVQSGNHLYLGLQEPNAAGETVIAYNVSNAGNPVRDQQLTAALAAVLSGDDQIPWLQKGVLGMTVMADSGYLSVISSAASDGAIRMITILKDPNYVGSFIRP